MAIQWLKLHASNARGKSLISGQRTKPLEEEKATYSSILAWRIPLTIVHGIAKSWTGLIDFHFHFLWKNKILRFDLCLGN